MRLCLCTADGEVKREPLGSTGQLWHGRSMPIPRAAANLPPLLLLALALGGCATVPGEDRLAAQDPLEKVNRGVWGVNMAADKVVIKPATKVYRAVAPQPVRQGVSNFFANLAEPWSMVNNLLQGKPKRAGQNLERFVVNSTIGVAGLFDRASKMGVRPAPEDFGQTMARWGVNGGPYLVLPLLGPSTLRDGVGSGIAAYADPVKIAINQADVNIWYKRGYLAAQIVSARSDLIETGGDAFLQSSLDPYAAARSAYLQRRRVQILDEEEGGGTALPGTDKPAEEAVPTPAGGAATTGPALPESAAPLPGDDVPPAATGTPDGSLPQSAAPLPGDEPAAAPHQE
jgi:phospholipid-binding lipoprotein MlaA